MIPIDANTIIDRGLQLSKNFVLEHVSSGAYHPVMAQWLPKYSAILIPDSTLPLNFAAGKVMPLWQIARNLQMGADGILENLLNGFGGDLVLQSGFMNDVPITAAINEIKHTIGQSFDIQIRGFENNMYSVAKEVQKLTKRANNLNLVFGSSSWIHIDVDPNRVGIPSSLLPDVEFSSVDLFSGVKEKGLTSLRGFI